MFMRSALVAACACALLVAAVTRSSDAQLPTYGVGRAPTAEQINAWNTTIPFDGTGLPLGSGTAAQGKAIYTERCAACHGPSGADGKYDPLVGGRGTLTTDKPVLTIGSFWPYAPTLWSYIKRAQPVDEPGSLTPEQVYAVTAYLLYLNGLIGEHDVMDARTLPQIRMPNRDGFVMDPRPDIGRTSRSSGGAHRR
jgi:S-disulfanyl-L-cysteine oxidoreductase SoxD